MRRAGEQRQHTCSECTTQECCDGHSHCKWKASSGSGGGGGGGGDTSVLQG